MFGTRQATHARCKTKGPDVPTRHATLNTTLAITHDCLRAFGKTLLSVKGMKPGSQKRHCETHATRDVKYLQNSRARLSSRATSIPPDGMPATIAPTRDINPNSTSVGASYSKTLPPCPPVRALCQSSKQCTPTSSSSSTARSSTCRPPSRRWTACWKPWTTSIKSSAHGSGPLACPHCPPLWRLACLVLGLRVPHPDLPPTAPNTLEHGSRCLGLSDTRTSLEDKFFFKFPLRDVPWGTHPSRVN